MKAGKFSYTFLCELVGEGTKKEQYVAIGPVEELRRPRLDYKALLALEDLLNERYVFSMLFSDAKGNGPAATVFRDLVHNFPAEKDCEDLSNISELKFRCLEENLADTIV